MRLKKKYKFILLGLLIIIMVATTVCYMQNKNKNDNQKLESINRDETESTNIEGLIIYQDENTTYLCDKNQIIYEFSNQEINSNINDYVKISYEGQLDINKSKQNIAIKNVEKLDKEFTLESLNNNNTKKAKEIVNKMSLEEIVGELYMVHHTSKSLKDVEKYHLGGLVLFGEAFKNKTKDEVINMINNLQQKASIPLLLGVDEEGGTVVRISSNKNLRSSAFLSPRTLYKEGGFALIKEDNIEKNNLLKSLGININLAPVLDISNDKNDYIYNRSIGLSPKLTGNFAITIIESSKESGIVNVLKHYPGYSKNKDTHKSSSIDTRTISEVEEDLIPFKMAINNGAEAIMISHNTVTALDDKNPASISINNHNYLRSTLNFKGMIITDALNMGATADIESMGIKSILAGNNILVTKNYARDIKEILDNVSNGNLSNKYLECLAIKIIEWKIEMGLIS